MSKQNTKVIAAEPLIITAGFLSLALLGVGALLMLQGGPVELSFGLR